jgi:hypothetical protein
MDQHSMLHPHMAVKVLHHPLLTARKQPRCLVAQGVEVLAFHHAAGDGSAPPIVGQLRVESPFVGRLVFKGSDVEANHQRIEVIRQRLPVVRIIDRQVVHAVSGRTQLTRQIAHRGEDGDDFLRVVQHVIGFLAHFHQDVQHVVALLLEPGVPWIELVPENQPKGCAGTHAVFWQRPRRRRCGKPCCRSRPGQSRVRGKGLSRGRD